MTESIPEPHTHTHASSGVASTFTKKYGPLPGYAWALLIAGSYVLYRYWKASHTAAQVNPTEGTVGTDIASGASSGIGSLGTGGGASGGSVTGTGAPTTNGQWAQQAVKLLGVGTLTPGEVSNAISDYLNGNPLSTAEAAIVNQALSLLGPPPEGVLPLTIIPDPPTGSTTPPPVDTPPPVSVTKFGGQTKGYSIQSTDTLNSIAQHFYGSTDPVAVADIRRINPIFNLIGGNDASLSALHDFGILVPAVSGDTTIQPMTSQNNWRIVNGILTPV